MTCDGLDITRFFESIARAEAKVSGTDLYHFLNDTNDAVAPDEYDADREEEFND